MITCTNLIQTNLIPCNDTLCTFLNQTGNVDRFVARCLPGNTPRPRNLVFLLNVGKSNGKVFLDGNLNPGNHWTFCHVDADRKLMTYADFLAWNHPQNLQSRISEFYEAVYGETMVGFSLHASATVMSRAAERFCGARGKISFWGP